MLKTYKKKENLTGGFASNIVEDSGDAVDGEDVVDHLVDYLVGQIPSRHGEFPGHKVVRNKWPEAGIYLV